MTSSWEKKDDTKMIWTWYFSLFCFFQRWQVSPVWAQLQHFHQRGGSVPDWQADPVVHHWPSIRSSLHVSVKLCPFANCGFSWARSLNLPLVSWHFISNNLFGFWCQRGFISTCLFLSTAKQSWAEMNKLNNWASDTRSLIEVYIFVCYYWTCRWAVLKHLFDFC